MKCDAKPVSSSTTRNVEYYWFPDKHELLDLVWTVEPSQQGLEKPCTRFNPDYEPPYTISIGLDAETLDKLFCFSVVTHLPFEEVAARLLMMETTLYGAFEHVPGPHSDQVRVPTPGRR